jgi:peptide/nickel transport system substrate-binding protein
VSLDPTRREAIDHLWLDTLTLDMPSRWNAAGQVVTALASYQPVAGDETIVDLVVRPGALFFDGTPVRAEDVQFAVERVRNGATATPHGWRTEHIERCERIGPQTVRLTLSRPDASLEASLAHQAFGVVRAGTNPPAIVGGSGPFWLRVRDGDRMLYARNEHFWQIGRPRIEAVHVEAIPDDTRRTTAIAVGTIDLVPNVPLLDIPMLRDEPSVYLVGGSSNRICHLQLNLQVPELRDARVRRLLSAAIDRERLVEVATAGQATPTGLLFPDSSWAFSGLDDVLQESPDRVREELRRLGIPSDLRLHMITDDEDATLATTAVVLQEQLATCGIALSVDLLRGRELDDALRDRRFDMFVGYTEPWRDPHELVRPLLATDGNLNYSGYANQHIDGLVRGAILQRPRALRQPRYRLIEERVRQDAPVIVLFRPHYFDAVKSDLVGYGAYPPVTSRGLLTVQPAAGDS